MVKLLKQGKGALFGWAARRSQKRLLARESITSCDPEDFSASLRDPNSYYLRSFQDFHRILPDKLRRHRGYFREDGRGFGEDAFHVMWWRLFNRFQPSSFLEIGVYWGQVISLISLLAKLEQRPCRVVGISPFSSEGDAVSSYRIDLNYLDDTLAHFRCHDLPDPELIKARSTDRQAVSVIDSTHWDMIYIDGNHDYEIAAADWRTCAAAVRPGGLIVLDDAGLETSYRPPRFATGGHPGPSRVAAEIDRSLFTEILQVGHNRVFQRNEA